MIRLSKGQQAQRDRLVSALENARASLLATVANYNETCGRARLAVESLLEHYSALLTEVEDFREQVSADQHSYHDDRPQRWQEGPQGEAYTGWMDAWDLPLEDVSLEWPDELEEPDLDHPEFIRDDWPDEP
jgi:hypothetical protein